MTPEEKARQDIDAQLAACGWVVQDHAAADFSAGRGIALRRLPLPAVPAVTASKPASPKPAARWRKASRPAPAEVLADGLDYIPRHLDRSVVKPDRIRTVLRAYRDVVQTELFPGRTLQSKTLIFAKDDSHAEDIVHLYREVHSRVCFEKMKGCGIRVLSPTDLQSVPGKDSRAKTRFVIVDCIVSFPMLWN
jgi:type I site-specific restriction endonuclease